ncbi:hypothetical protein L6164_017768 [Bauhinia variegata]|uniref:Uncharacterized protein n=1 Tax=Bauhinia variegata TaxID=167791 RepID=A0ACB9N956_BAUVA|nr:hypothetical protein L6164_017768 [Bauhinia variegata]
MKKGYWIPSVCREMEDYDLPGQRKDPKQKGRNVVWSIAMDKCLIEALAVQAKNGKTNVSMKMHTLLLVSL